ncbi:universal stress protein [Streptomyces tsukubensis]|uniref:UspA domain-containing protein n=1 Tax=Streptomyces tsukubensis TaxID=83656 RepID=A0A1V4A819_9ACTN|nr:universal stress protein [Streptomyces tsukubensis]OON77980.1 hypothetical protein B1H18_17255 [Streptomyces tsukubensis]QFR97144.1 universal stress protein [Streptomyces tsukubensis]
MSTLPVIAAVDGSEDSLRALEFAIVAARLWEAPLRVLHVRQYAAPARTGDPAAGSQLSNDPVLDRVKDGLTGRSDLPPLEFATAEGAPARTLPEESAGAQLLVLGSRGRGGFASLLLGSNGLASAREADCPVVVVPRPGREVIEESPVAPGPRVVVGMPVDSTDESAVAFAFEEAERRGARLQVVSAYAWPTLVWTAVGDYVPAVDDKEEALVECEALAEEVVARHRPRHPRVAAEVTVRDGDAAGHLVSCSAGAELVVVGRHRRRLTQPGRLLGSVTQAVLLHAAAPIAVVPLKGIEADSAG